MITQVRIPKKVSGKVVVNAVIILIGIVALAAGHFFNITILFYIGIFVTLAGVLLEILYVINHTQQH